MRRCVGCGQRKPQAELRRFVAESGRLVPDPGRRRPGRGAYCCRDEACWNRAVQGRAFARTLRRPVTMDHEFVESE